MPKIFGYNRYKKPWHLACVLVRLWVATDSCSTLRETLNIRRLDALKWVRGNTLCKIYEPFIQTSSDWSYGRWLWTSSVQCAVNVQSMCICKGRWRSLFLKSSKYFIKLWKAIHKVGIFLFQWPINFRNSFLKEADEYKWLWLIYGSCMAGRKSGKVMETWWIIKTRLKEWQLSVTVWQIEPLLMQWIFYMHIDWSLWHLILATFSQAWCSVRRRRRTLRAHESDCKLKMTVFWGPK